jgi:glucose-6-phosphate-specific signal transduction histidine kinase
MIENNPQRGKAFNPWHFTWISVVISELFTATVSTIQYRFFYPETDLWYMLKVGAIDSLFVPLIVAPIIIYFLRSESALKKINTQLEIEIAERKRIEEGLLEAKREREKLIADLQKAFAEIKTLHGILPTCVVCKKIRDDAGAWKQMEIYIKEHSEAEFSHGYCPECAIKALEELDEFTNKNKP